MKKKNQSGFFKKRKFDCKTALIDIRLGSLTVKLKLFSCFFSVDMPNYM